MERGTQRDHAVLTELEQATLRVRLVATALGATILMLLPGHDQVAAGSVLLGYAAVAVLLRAWGAGVRAAGPIGIGLDVLFGTALSLLLPFSASWVLYPFAIGIAALRGGVRGLVATTAACIVAYDVVLAVRGSDALAADLWRIQVLLAFAVLAAELVWGAARMAHERRELRTYSLAQRDIAAAAGSEELLERIVDHAVRSFGAAAAWIEPELGSGVARHARGPAPDPADVPAHAMDIELAPDIALHALFDGDGASARGSAALRDLAADARPLLAAARDRARERRERDAEQRVLAAIHRLAREDTAAGALAQVIATAQEIAGVSAIVRAADGVRLVGDLDAEVATTIARDGVPPRLAIPAPTANASGATTSAAAVSVGPGLVLVSLGTRRPLERTDLAVLDHLGDAAASALERVAERDELVASASELRRRAEELERELRERDDAVASAVHELRNPLTSVQAYGQLMSRNLAAVQRQVGQLDALIGDLLRVPGGAPQRPLAFETTDVAREALEATSRLRISVPGTEVSVSADRRGGPCDARIDAVRFAQVLDNVLRNAAKYSPAGSPIDVRVSRREGDVLVTVADRGDGIAPGELERIFERYSRGSQHEGSPAGAGIGLAIARGIVSAHGGRIWAESDGLGKGSTFTIALPAADAVDRRTPQPEGSTTREG